MSLSDALRLIWLPFHYLAYFHPRATKIKDVLCEQYIVVDIIECFCRNRG